MKLDHTPHPVIEDHYHIRELIEGQEKRHEARVHYQEVDKARDSFLKELATLPEYAMSPFWCRHCKQDFHARVRREVDAWGTFAFYRTKHRTCGRWAIRHITDKERDPYWMLSKSVADDRDKHRDELLQSFETGFNTLYGKKY